MSEKEYIVATYLVETDEASAALRALCRGQSVGNPSILTAYETKEFLNKWSAHGTSTRASDGVYAMRIQFPQANFGTEGVNYLLSVLLGGQCDVDLIRGCRLMELDLGFQARHLRRPRWGIPGLRHQLAVPARALLGGILKPKIGLNPRQLADLVQQMADGGCDFIKEDEILADQYWCPMKQRIPLVAEVLKPYNVIYLTCVTGDGSAVWQKARLAKRLGASGVHVNLWCGLGTYLDVHDKVELPLHFQKSGDKVWTTGPFSLEATVLCQLVNLVGCDTAHVGMYGGYLSEDVSTLKRRMAALGTTLPTFSCGMTPHLAEQIIQRFGTNLALFSGGWIHGQGDVRQACQQMRRVIDAASHTVRLPSGMVHRGVPPLPVTDGHL